MVDVLEVAYVYSEEFLLDKIRQWTARSILDSLVRPGSPAIPLGPRRTRYRPHGLSLEHNFLFEMRYEYFFRRYESMYFVTRIRPLIPQCPETGEWDWTLE